MQESSQCILGVDPGSRHTGFGIVRVEKNCVQHLAHGVIELKAAWAFADRLKVLQQELQELYKRYPVSTTVVEKIFFGKNADSAFRLGHARGVCLLVAAQNGGRIEEYAARYVKKCITGSGAADKTHVQLVVLRLLGLKNQQLAFDATDALSLALTHARFLEVSLRAKRWERSLE